jgi:hypothetical protein
MASSTKSGSAISFSWSTSANKKPKETAPLPPAATPTPQPSASTAALPATTPRNVANAILQFNLCIGEYAHLSWIEEFFPHVPAGIRLHEISRFLLDALAPHNEVDLVMSAPKVRVTLLDRPTLNQIFIYLGALPYREMVRKTVLRSQQRQQETMLGSDLWRWLLDPSRVAEPSPLADGFSDIVPLHRVNQEKLRIQGLAMCFETLRRENPSVCSRFLYKLDRTDCEQAARMSQVPLIENHTITNLLKERFEPWHWVLS